MQSPPSTNAQDIGELHKALMQQVAELQDRDAFRDLFQHFAPRIKALMMKSGAANGEAEDIAQDVMLKVWQKSMQYTSARGAVSTWIFTIARNVRIDRLRRGSSRPYDDIDEIELASEDADAEAEMLATQQAQHVQAAMAELPDEQKLIIEMAFQQSLTQSEIATRLALPLGTIKSRMRLAYQKLRVTLEDVK